MNLPYPNQDEKLQQEVSPILNDTNKYQTGRKTLENIVDAQHKSRPIAMVPLF